MDRWLVFQLMDQQYAVGVEQVRELIKLQESDVHRLPAMTSGVEGVVWLRDHSVGVVDFRSLLGMPSIREETQGVLKMLDEREQDHLRWLSELEASVRENRPFTLTTDPHKCKFGLWYDQLTGNQESLRRFTNGDPALIYAVEQFDQPHRHIHELGKHVTALVAQQQHAEAQRLIDTTRDNELSALRQLFGRCRELVRQLRAGLLVVVEGQSGEFGALVDQVDGVMHFTAEQIDRDGLSGCRCRFVAGVARQAHTAQMIQLLDLDAIQQATACLQLCA